MLKILIDRLQPFLLILHAPDSLVHLGYGGHGHLHRIVLLCLGVQDWRGVGVLGCSWHGSRAGVGARRPGLALTGRGRRLRLHPALDVGPGDAPASKLGVLLSRSGAKIHPRLHLPLPGVYCHLEGVEHDVGVAVLVLPLLDDLLIDEVPLRDWPAILTDVLAQLRDGMILAGVLTSRGPVVL